LTELLRADDFGNSCWCPHSTCRLHIQREGHKCSHRLAMLQDWICRLQQHLFIHPFIFNAARLNLQAAAAFIHSSLQIVRAIEPSNSSISMTLSLQFACAWYSVQVQPLSGFHVNQHNSQQQLVDAWYIARHHYSWIHALTAKCMMLSLTARSQ